VSEKMQKELILFTRYLYDRGFFRTVLLNSTTL